MSAATLHMHPPSYPERFEPFSCPHPLPMQICSACIKWRSGGGGDIVVRHARCLGCGAPVGTGEVRNIFVDIACLSAEEAFRVGAIRSRLNAMQDIYLRRAEMLFGPDGWLGDESWRALAEMIDPHLTMRVTQAGEHGDGTRFARLNIDDDYWPAPIGQPPHQLDMFGAA